VSEPNIALVTGGSTGIGAEICRTMLAAGYGVLSLDRRAPDWSDARLETIAVDLFDAAATKAAAAQVAAQFRVTHFVHNAGVIRPNVIDDVPAEDVMALAQLHLGSALILAQAVLPGMKARRFGRIVLMSSRAALGVPTRTAYAATKAGMFGLARTWALELAPSGVTVNVVAPGPIAGTGMFHEVVAAGSERETALARAIPVQRLGRPDDVARAVMFFADRANDFITGQALYVCGGASVGTIAI
jgi:NAD(P)-dependent dehydrogenase (short-subunit alcohol dehydrogenase family)